MKLLVPMLSLAVATSIQAQQRLTDHSQYANNPKLWNTPLSDFQKHMRQLRFQWQTNQKDSLRSTVKLPIFGVMSGETIIAGKDNKVNRVKFTVYNRGDDGGMSKATLDNKFNQLKAALDKLTGRDHKDQSKTGAVKLTSYLWKTDATAYELEKSSSGNSAEFLYLKLSPLAEAKKTPKIASRTSLKSNVIEENGEVYIGYVPMVDQGRKGYCACASSARIFQYYGRDLSMHEVAQMAGSTANGTSIAHMVEAFKKAAGKLNSRVVILYEYPKYMSRMQYSDSQYKSMSREIVSDVNKYQSVAKQKGKKQLNIGGKVGGRLSSDSQINIFQAQQMMDPEIYKEVMIKKTNYSRFKSSIKKYIDDGIPVGWCLNLGMFKEPGLPQTGGGHLRLIIGYNKDKDTVIYSDSWGKGHAKKEMPMAHAYCMTNVLLAVPPTR